MRNAVTATAVLALLLTGCWGSNWVNSPGRVEKIEIRQLEMQELLDTLVLTVEGNESLLRGLTAQSGMRTAELIDRIAALAAELERALQKLDDGGSLPVQDTVAGPGVQVLYNEAYMQYQQGNFEIASEGFRDVVRTHPSSSLADDAMYFMALSHQSMGDAHRAIEDLVAIYYVYPSSDRAPAGLARAAAIYGAHGASDDRERLNILLLEFYPGSDEAALVREEHGGSQ